MDQSTAPIIDDSLLKRLACPVDNAPLAVQDQALTCPHSHRFPVVGGVPILLHPDIPVEVDVPPSDQQHLEAIHREGYEAAKSQTIDPYVQGAVAATNGIMYRALRNALSEYPIPSLDGMEPGAGRTLLDVGCNWGRWSIAANRRGYEVVGIDPNAEAVFAAQRVAKQQSARVHFVVGDARFLPFSTDTFDVVYSYSVLQHFAKTDVHKTLNQISRVLKSEGKALIQMANAFGLRSIYHQARRRFAEVSRFDVRYWTPSELKRTWDKILGETILTVDGFFSLNPQEAERRLLPKHYRAVVDLSCALKRLSKVAPKLHLFADSIFLQSSTTKDASR